MYLLRKWASYQHFSITWNIHTPKKKKEKRTVVLVTLFTDPYCENTSFSGDQNEWECYIVWGMSWRHHYTRQARRLGDKDQHKNWNNWQLEGSTFCSFIFTCYNPLFSLDLSPILYLLFQALMCFLTTCKMKLKKLVLHVKVTMHLPSLPNS